jgi:hypothetical protein
MKRYTLPMLKRTAAALGITVGKPEPGQRTSFASYSGRVIALTPRESYAFVLAHELSHQVSSMMNTPAQQHRKPASYVEILNGRLALWRLSLRAEEATADMVAEVLTGSTRAYVDKAMKLTRSSGYPPVTGARTKAYVEWYAAHIVNRILDATPATPKKEAA